MAYGEELRLVKTVNSFFLAAFLFGVLPDVIALLSWPLHVVFDIPTHDPTFCIFFLAIIKK
jgi:hypothetical protein